MVVQYPHTLKFKLHTEAGEPYQDENGDWVIPEPVTEDKQFSCRVEPNGGGKTIAGEDGQSLVYSWTVYTLKDVPSLGYGTPVEVYNGSELIASGTVKLFSRGQLNTRIWL